jgi:hypothetical protein
VSLELRTAGVKAEAYLGVIAPVTVIPYGFRKGFLEGLGFVNRDENIRYYVFTNREGRKVGIREDTGGFLQQRHFNAGYLINGDPRISKLKSHFYFGW